MRNRTGLVMSRESGVVVIRKSAGVGRERARCGRERKTGVVVRDRARCGHKREAGVVMRETGVVIRERQVWS